ncbi:MAG: NYN domain-containing protein [Cyclonatronaceae bacterium]
MNQLRDDIPRHPARALNDLRLAVLIDADNVSHSHISDMMEEATRYGTPTFKRIYGDWTQPHLVSWKKVLLEHAITPIQQYSYTKGKNATDSAMIIDAMDILYSGKVDGFCIVSSDSDFTRLVIRLREAGMRVIGMGEKKTPKPFIAACDKFLFIEVLASSTNETEIPADSPEGESKPSPKKAAKQRPASPKTKLRSKKPDMDKRMQKLIRLSVSDVADDDGWAFLGEVGNMILKKEPSFDPRNYGFNKLTPLLKQLDLFEFDERQSQGSNVRQIYIRDKQQD